MQIRLGQWWVHNWYHEDLLEVCIQYSNDEGYWYVCEILDITLNSYNVDHYKE